MPRRGTGSMAARRATEDDDSVRKHPGSCTRHSCRHGWPAASRRYGSSTRLVGGVQPSRALRRPVRPRLRVRRDLFAPGVDASVRCAAANVVGRSVRAGFGARPRTGDDREALTGLGLTNPTQAEIHAVVRTHGPDIPELVHEQIRSCLASPAVASPASPRRRDGPPVRGGGGWAPSPTSGPPWKG